MLETLNELREQEDKTGVAIAAQRHGDSLTNGFNLRSRLAVCHATLGGELELVAVRPCREAAVYEVFDDRIDRSIVVEPAQGGCQIALRGGTR